MEPSKDDRGGGAPGGEHSSVNKQISSSADSSSSEAKSCKGALYYSSILKSKGRNPRCIGISRSLQQVPSYIVTESEDKVGRSLVAYKYSCIGYAVFVDNKDSSADVQRPQFPVCNGFEVLVERELPASDHSPAHAHAREDDQGSPQPPPHRVGQEFLERFTRNADLVASGVAKNLRKVGNHIKDSIDNVLYPYRRRPK